MERGQLIFTENFEGSLVPMRPAAPATEEDLQDIIAKFPDVISGEEGDLILVSREQGVPGSQDGNDRWSLDHLFVSRDAIPVLVEVKRASDTRIRREVIGQLLDYAANGVVYWPEDLLEASFVETCRRRGEAPEAVLQAFMDDRDPSAFWAQVQANLVAGRLRLLVVADLIPPELARIIEFLNDQMRADVKAIELRYYRGSDGRRTLAPRVIGETEKSRVGKGPRTSVRGPVIEVEEWLETRLSDRDEETLRGSRVHLGIMSRLGAEVSVASTYGSVRAAFISGDGNRVRPLDLDVNGKVSIGLKHIKERPQLIDEEARKAVCVEMSNAVGGIEQDNLNGFPGFPAARLCDPEIAEAYERVASRLVDLAVQPQGKDDPV